MKKIFIIMLVVLMFLAVAVTVMAWGVKCPVDGFSMRFTGYTKVDFGRLMKEYKCVMGHTYWFK